MASSASTVFTGQSSFSSDFQTVLSRAVSIASLPMQTLQNTISTVTGQQQALSTLQSAFSNLQNDIISVNLAAQGNPSAQSSQASAVQATAAAGASPGTYTIEVDSIGSSTSTMSAAPVTKVTDPTVGNITTASSLTLTVNGTDYTINPAGSSLQDLANAVNTSGANVQATVVNVGSNASPDYRLAVSSTNLGPDTIQLNDGTDLLGTLSSGTYSSYTVNGSGSPVLGTSDQVTLSTGLTVTLQQPTTTGTPAVITVATSYSALSSALSSLASDYNSAATALNQHVGENGGALTGQSIIYSLKSVLQSVAQYTGASGSVATLNDLGLSLNATGELIFNSSTFSSAKMASVQQFLGSVTTGGFLQTANTELNAVANNSTGVIQTEITTDQNRINNQNDLIAQDQIRINNLTTTLQAQLSAADAAISTLQSQKSYFTALFDATYLNNNGSSGG